MIYKPYKDGEKLSLLGMGNMRLPTMGDKPQAPIDRKRAQEIIDYAMAHGINYYDTAYVYHSGESEKFLGEAMAKYPRESYHLATKYFVLANPDYKAVFEEQLSRLKTGYIDFYLIHGIFDHTADTYFSNGCIDYFLEQKKAGRIRYLGFSIHASLDTLKRVVSHHQWDFAQIQANYLDWTYSNAKEQYECITEHNIPIIVMEPIRGGRLATLSPAANDMLKEAQPGKSIASWALRWLMRLPNVQVILSGMSTLDQIKDNVDTVENTEPLTDGQEQLLMKACGIFQKDVKVPCTSCRYCCDNCPQGLDIPKLLEFYNTFKIDGAWGLDGLKKLPEDKQPSNCIACGACAEHCPQSIHIPELLKELAEAVNQR